MAEHATKMGLGQEALTVIGMLPARGFTALAWIVGLVTLLVAAPGLGR